MASRFWRLGLEWLSSTRSVVGSSYNDEETGPEIEITHETAPEPNETSSATGPKSDDQEEDVGQGAPASGGVINGNVAINEKSINGNEQLLICFNVGRSSMAALRQILKCPDVWII